MSLTSIQVNTNQVVSIDNEPIYASDNLVKSSGIYSAIKDSKLLTGDVSVELFGVEGGYYEDGGKNNILKCTMNYYQADTIWGNKYRTENNIVSGIYWLSRNYNSLGVSIYKVNIVNKETTLIKEVPYNSSWENDQLIKIPFDNEVYLLENEYIGIDGPIMFTDTLTDQSGKSFFLYNNVLGGSDNTAIGFYSYSEKVGRLNTIETEVESVKSDVDNISLSIENDSNINNVANWTTNYFTAGVIFCPDESVNVGIVSGVTWKCNKRVGENVKLYKCNILSSIKELIFTYNITNALIDGTLINIMFNEDISVGENEAIGIEGPLYYWDGHSGSYQIAGTTVTHNQANIGISTFKSAKINISQELERLSDKTDHIEEELGNLEGELGTIVTDDTNIDVCDQQYYQENTVWGNTYKLSSPVYGIIWKVRKYNNLGISIYKVNSTNAQTELIKTVSYDDNWVEGNILTIDFDAPITLLDEEFIGIDAPIYYNDRLAAGEGAEFFVYNGYYTNDHTLVGVQTFTKEINFKEMSALSESNRIKNKIVAWYGTSIPAGEPHTNQKDIYSYANIAVKRLGGIIRNYCVSGSCLISKENTESTTYNNIRFSDTTALINYQNSMLDLIGTVNEPEWFIFDFGANDATFYKSQFDALDFDNLDFTSTDKKTFLGAYNLVIKSLLQVKPKAKIILVTHFSDDSVNGTHQDYYLNLNKLIRRIGEYWQIPVNDMSHKCGFLYRNDINTLNAYMPIDGLHPGNELSVVHMLADIHCKYLLNV